MASRTYDVPGPWDVPYEDRGDWKEHFAKEEAALEVLQREAEAATGLVGKLVSFGVADGRAIYRVESTKPLKLAHVPFLDAYQIPDAHLRGLRVSDIKDMVEREEKFKSLFGGA